MRRSFFIGLAALTGVSCIFPMMAYADNEETLPASTEATSDSEYWGTEPSYGAIEEEESEEETYGDGFGPHGEYDTYDEYLASLSQETLTPEQIEWGYQIIDGRIVSPKELEGDPGEGYQSPIVGGVTPNASTGYVTFIMAVPTGMKDTGYITVLNEDDYKSYSALMYPVNSYKTTISLPAGTYIFDQCGITSDPDYRYWSETKEFTVEAGLSQIVKIELKDSYTETAAETEPATLGPYSTTVENPIETDEDGKYVEHSDKAGSTPDYEVSEGDTKHFGIANIIFILICIGGPLIAAYIWWRNNTETKSEDSID